MMILRHPFLRHITYTARYIMFLSFWLSLGALFLTIQDTRLLVPLSIFSRQSTIFRLTRTMYGDLTADGAAFVYLSNTYYAWG